MKYFFPDSQDTVDPSFDFKKETRSNERVRHRDDQYAHEVFSAPAFDGLLVSKGIVDGYGNTGSRYTLAQRHRLYREGIRKFFRLEDRKLSVMGDCGAFTYVREPEPPYTVEQVIDFYVECGFDHGISVDHVIFNYQPKWDAEGFFEDIEASDARNRQEITLNLAAEFMAFHRKHKLAFEPMGAAQGWSPRSYAHSVLELQKIGFDYIALGGMVALKTKDILECLRAISEIRNPATRLHLLGVTRTDHLEDFANLGVYSFDSTSPLRQAFKDDKDNYYAPERTYTAIRIPQVDANPTLLKRISSGQVSQDKARKLEGIALEAFEKYDSGAWGLTQALDAIVEYDNFCDPRKDMREIYREVLIEQPWKQCPCDVCRKLGYHVILFRGAERNRRRGFHNVWVFYQRVQARINNIAAKQADSVGK